MRDVATKADGVDSLAAGDFNATQAETETVVTSSDQTLDPAGGADTDLNMLSKAIAGYAGAAWGYTDSGAVNAHVVAIASNLKSITKYFDNLMVAYVPNGVNTSTAVTVNVSTLGVKSIRLIGGTLPGVGTITNTIPLVLKYNDSAGYFEIVAGLTTSISGLSKNLVVVAGGTPDEQVDIDADELRLQDVNGTIQRLIDIDFTVDNTVSGALGLFTGSVAADTWYAMWVTSGSSGNTSGLHLSGDLATMLADAPAGFDVLGFFIGWIRTDATSDFIPITQNGNKVNYDDAQLIKDGSFTTSAWTAQVVSTIFPTTAKMIKMHFGATANPVQIGLSPRSDGEAGSLDGAATNGSASTYGGILTTAREIAKSLLIPFASTIYYWTTGATSTLEGAGWEY